MPTKRTTPRMVDPWANASDFEAALLGTFGFSTNAISNKTGLTKCQVTYRLRKFEILRKDYRDGNNIGAEAVIRVARREVIKPLSEGLAQVFKANQ